MKNLILNLKLFAASLIFGLIFTSFICINYSIRAQKAIADEVIRFHVLANSNSNFDQTLKLKVRDEILRNLHDKLSTAKNKSQTKLILQKNLPLIKKIAHQTIIKNGYNYDVKVLLTTDTFPTKTYADLKLPPGIYETLQIIIGNGQGENWWCVMFPPLCFVDAAKKSVPDNLKNDLKNILTDDEFKLINSKNENISVKAKFKIVEAWQKFNIKFVKKKVIV